MLKSKSGFGWVALVALTTMAQLAAPVPAQEQRPVINRKDCTPQSEKPSCISYLDGLYWEKAESPEDPYVLLRLARAYQKEGNIPKALQFLDEYLVRNSTDENVTLEAAKVAAGLPDFELAEKYYRKALSFGHNQKNIHYHMGLLYINNDKPDEAIRHYELVLRDDPDDPDALANIGLAYLKTGQLKKAITHLHRAAQLENGNPDRFNMLGLAYLQMNRLDDAVKAFKRATELKPDSIAYHYNLGEAYREKGMTEQSLYHFDEALQHQAVTPDDWFNQGKVNFRLGLYENSIRIYNNILQHYMDPVQKAQVYLALGYAYEAMDNGPQARTAFSNYLKIIPTGNTAEAVKLRLGGMD